MTVRIGLQNDFSIFFLVSYFEIPACALTNAIYFGHLKRNMYPVKRPSIEGVWAFVPRSPISAVHGKFVQHRESSCIEIPEWLSSWLSSWLRRNLRFPSVLGYVSCHGVCAHWSTIQWCAMKAWNLFPCPSDVRLQRSYSKNFQRWTYNFPNQPIWTPQK